MTCDDLERYLDGDLEDKALAGFREHLGRCARCAVEVSGQERLDRALAAASRGLAAPPRLVRRIEDEIDALEGRSRTFRRWVAAAAVLAVGLGVGVLLVDRGGGPVGVERPAPETAEPSPPVVPRLIPKASPVASIELGDGSSALAVPVATSGIDATIVFVYPVLGGGQPRSAVK